MRCLNPRQVIVNREPKVGAPITYDYNGKRVNKKNIKHIKPMVLPGGITGVGPLQAGRDDIENARRLLLTQTPSWKTEASLQVSSPPTSF